MSSFPNKQGKFCAQLKSQYKKEKNWQVQTNGRRVVM